MNRKALLLPLLALVSCHQNGASVQIQGICAPSTDCKFSGKCEMFALGDPRFDVGKNPTGTLMLFLQVENQLPDNANADTYRLNTNDAHFDKGTFDGVPVAGVSGTAFAGGTSVVEADIPMFVTSIATGTLTGKLRLAGYYDDQTRFETAEFPVTIEVCSGCTTGTCVDACPQIGQYPAACMDPTSVGT